MNNKQIAQQFDLLAKLMELHDENPFKIRSYANAYLSLRKLEGDLATMPLEELAIIKGVGQAIADKIQQLILTGEMKTLNHFKDITPTGVQDMLRIKGLGPKKVKQIWKEMEITSVGELLYACNENRLVHFKGFGEKAQEEIRKKIEYFIDSQGKFLYAHVHKPAEHLLDLLTQKYHTSRWSICGDLGRKMPEVKGIELMTDMAKESLNTELFTIDDDGKVTYQDLPLFIYHVDKDPYDKELFIRSCSTTFLSTFDDNTLLSGDEIQIFKNSGFHFIPAELREIPEILVRSTQNMPEYIDVGDIKGIIHNHSTYSDGLHTLAQMADYVHACGYAYFVISDHSKSAGYAGGLNEEKVQMQWEEIDTLNKGYTQDYHIFKSIESDILTDGSLDYSDDILAGFDLVIASVHSVLNMDIERATSRLIRAVENPYTRILGHPTGRLLLARPGYPLDYKKVIDACAANGVAIELNANPQRLDIDWTWIPYCLEKDVMIAINPDAHSKESIHYIQYGVAAARKGGLLRSRCLNTKSLSEFRLWLDQK